MSLHTIVNDGLAARLPQRRARAVAVQPETNQLAVRLTGASMRVMETGLAMTAIVVAVLIGLGR